MTENNIKKEIEIAVVQELSGNVCDEENKEMESEKLSQNLPKMHTNIDITNKKDESEQSQESQNQNCECGTSNGSTEIKQKLDLSDNDLCSTSFKSDVNKFGESSKEMIEKSNEKEKLNSDPEYELSCEKFRALWDALIGDDSQLSKNLQNKTLVLSKFSKKNRRLLYKKLREAQIPRHYYDVKYKTATKNESSVSPQNKNREVDVSQLSSVVSKTQLKKARKDQKHLQMEAEGKQARAEQSTSNFQNINEPASTSSSMLTRSLDWRDKKKRNFFQIQIEEGNSSNGCQLHLDENDRIAKIEFSFDKRISKKSRQTVPRTAQNLLQTNINKTERRHRICIKSSFKGSSDTSSSNKIDGSANPNSTSKLNLETPINKEQAITSLKFDTAACSSKASDDHPIYAAHTLDDINADCEGDDEDDDQD